MNKEVEKRSEREDEWRRRLGKTRKKKNIRYTLENFRKIRKEVNEAEKQHWEKEMTGIKQGRGWEIWESIVK